MANNNQGIKDISQPLCQEVKVNQLLLSDEEPKERTVPPRQSSIIEERETSEEQENRIRLASPFGQLKSWSLLRVMVKANDDVRQEQFAVQLLS